MTNDRSTRGDGGRFTGSTGAGRIPTTSSARPGATADGAVGEQQDSDDPTSMDALHERFLALEDLPADEGEPPMRGWYDDLRWHPELEDLENLSRRKTRRLGGDYHPFTPLPITPWETPVPAAVAGDASEAEAAIQALNERSHPALKPLARLLLRTESIASSKTEGLEVAADNLARAEATLEQGRTPPEKALEILRNVQAMETAIEQASQDRLFTGDDLCAIHARLMAGTSEAGTIRVVQNWIGGQIRSPVGADFVPPPHERVPALLNDLVAAVNDDTLPPVIQAAIVHAQLETIHPFTDGNGRTGRALIHVIWRRRGLTPAYVPPISLVFSRNRDRYINGLTAFREGRVNDWFTYFSDAAAQSAGRAQDYISEVSGLQEQWRQQVRETLPTMPRRDAAVWALIDELPAHPAVTSTRAVYALGKSKPAVSQAIDQLEQAGVLRRANQGARNRIWEVPSLLDLISATEEG